jgi:hypothetical protein
MSTPEQEAQTCRPCKPHNRHSDCWPNDNDYLDGRTETGLPSPRAEPVFVPRAMARRGARGRTRPGERGLIALVNRRTGS